MAELDDIIHQPLRLKIMAALNALPIAAPGLEFSRLKKLTGATDGNLGAHIETLAKAGYVAVDKAFVGKKPQTTVTATAAGRGAFARHVATLQEIIAASARQVPQPLIPPCRRGRDSCDRHACETAHLALSHAHSPARFRRPRTRSGVEDRGFAPGDETLVRAGQCRHRPRSRMRRRSTSPTMPR